MKVNKVQSNIYRFIKSKRAAVKAAKRCDQSKNSAIIK